jgi:hypothetical protein
MTQKTRLLRTYVMIVARGKENKEEAVYLCQRKELRKP